MTRRAPARAFPLFGGVILVLLGVCAVRMWPHPGAVAPFAIEVDLSGCAVFLRDSVCELGPDAELRVLVRAQEPTQARLLADGKPLESRRELTPAGYSRLVTRVPAGTKELLVIATPVTGAREARHNLRLHRQEEPPLIGEVRRLRGEGKLAEAINQLQNGAPTLPPRWQAVALGLRARIALQQGHIEEAIEGLQASRRTHRELGVISEEAYDTFALVHTLAEHGRRFAQAQTALEELNPSLRSFREGEAEARYYHGLLAFESGDIRGALKNLRRSSEEGEQLGMTEPMVYTEHLLAETLRALGRTSEAVSRMGRARRLLGAHPTACQEAWLLTNTAWFEIQEAMTPASVSSKALSPSARQALDRALLLLSASCPIPDQLQVVRTERALLELLEGRPEQAAVELKEARAIPGEVDARVRVWFADVEARLALARKQGARAAELYEGMARMAERAGLPEARWRGALGRAEALESIQNPGARDAYAAAEAILDQQAFAIPLGEGRGGFFHERSWGTRLHVDLLVRQGDLRGAMAAARVARSRALRLLWTSERLSDLDEGARLRWQRAATRIRTGRDALARLEAESWALAADQEAIAKARRDGLEREIQAALDDALSQLGTPPKRPAMTRQEREAILLAHPLREGWLLLLDAPSGLRWRRISALPLSEPLAQQAEWLIRPFAPALVGVEQLRILAYGEAQTLDWQALPHEGLPLAAQLPVVYGLDLARSSAPASPHRRASILSDPSGDLRQARAEGREAASLLAAAGYEVEHRTGREVTRTALEQALSSASLLHFAGHGRFQGEDGLASGLLLADKEVFSLRDLLVVPAVPGVVLLSGCETGRSDLRGGDGLGLAQAFLLAGSSAVLAAPREVDDTATAAFLRSLLSEMKEQKSILGAYQRASRATAITGRIHPFRLHVL